MFVMQTAEVDRLYTEFGKSLRRHRQARSLTQEQLGAQIGLSRTSIVNIEGGRQHVLLHQIMALARALGLSARDLLPSQSPRDAGSQLEPVDLPSGTEEQLTEWAKKIVQE
jgi:transcriptional regulator with XRE-family HTH domain